jgi:hypothetical protein
MKGDGIKCRKDDHFNEVFFMISAEIKKILIDLHIELNKPISEEKSNHLLSKATAELFNIVNCREKEFYDLILKESVLKEQDLL